ncbi:Chloroperoxidase [Mycena crocata]|nr:Chloroperoxidase [Mycena crocata]
MSSSPLIVKSPADNHYFMPAGKSERRSPCPALNALANHGYIPRCGTNITFMQLLRAVENVYNLTLPLALLLTLVGFLTCAKFSLHSPSPKSPSATSPQKLTSLCRDSRWWLTVSWTLDLADLSAQGWNKITHDASLVHASGVSSHAPDPELVASLLRATPPNGITLEGLAQVHAARERSLPSALSGFHEQVALGECALGWLVMRNLTTGTIEQDTLGQWYGEERLPVGWWNSRRPVRPVGLLEARKTAGQAQQFAKHQ